MSQIPGNKTKGPPKTAPVRHIELWLQHLREDQYTNIRDREITNIRR